MFSWVKWTINKKDHETILNLYHKTYLALGEKRTKENISDFVNYLLKKPLKLKILYDNQIVGAFIADIKPRHTGSMLYDGEMFIDPEYQKMGFGTLLFRKSLEIAIHKIQSAFDLVKKPCFIEDTALFFEEWGNALPGPYIKDFVKYIGTKNLTNLLKNNFNATARTTIAYHDGEKIHLMIGEKKGKIVHHCGIDSFARDPIFQPEGSAITYAEMKLEEKNQISHRFIAFQNFRKILGYE